jgi:hypothetical protein
MGIDTREKRRERQNLVSMGNPQSGVDVLKGEFSGPTKPIPGVEAKDLQPQAEDTSRASN